MADLDPKDVAIEIETMLKEARPLFFPAECCIYRVPHEIYKLNIDAYTPKVVSIGPFHRRDSRLLKMEGHKQIYCQKFLEISEASLDKLVGHVQELESKVRRSYSDNIELSKKDFVKVILVDCAFVFELFLRDVGLQPTDDDAISLTPWLSGVIKLDLVLLENQLPFFVLEELYNLAFASLLNGIWPSFVTLASHYFAYNLNFSNTGSIAHFTDLLRTSSLQPAANKLHLREGKPLNHLRSATELKVAGVELMVNETNGAKSHCLLDFQYSGGILKIPQIIVEDWTEIRLRNMVALEQCRYPGESYITDYVAVLDFLINTDKDVDFLVKREIIVNWLGDSNAVANMFNGLGKHVAQVNFNRDFLRICQDLDAYCNNPVRRKLVTLKRDYCNTPWKMVASIAAVVLLILTVVQTVCSVLQVV